MGKAIPDHLVAKLASLHPSFNILEYSQVNRQQTRCEFLQMIVAEELFYQKRVCGVFPRFRS